MSTPAIAAVPDDAALLEALPADSSIEARFDADIDGDGNIDVAFVGGNQDQRWLVVERGRNGGGFEPASTNKALATYALGPASLSLGKHVLLVEDLTGGTTATTTTYRYRFDPAAGRMRLIGIDTERYSRTFSHDSLKISWNLLTGDFVLARSILNQRPAGRDNAAYRYTRPERTIRKSNPVYMEDTPDPDDLIDAEVVPAGEDRD
ncbi:MAG: hypothetical protein QM719_01725 [Thermomonas sp.]